MTLCTPDGRVVCEACEVAATTRSRLRGLLGRDGLGAREGLLLRPASSIHTFFMRFPIDVVFLDAELRVVKVVERLAPWRLAGCRGARQALQLPSGACSWRRIEVGLELATVDGAVRRAA